MSWLECNSWSNTNTTHTVLYGVADALSRVRGFLRRSRHLVLVVCDGCLRPWPAPRAPAPVPMVEAVLVVERREGEAAMRLLTSAASLGDVRVVLTHRLGL